MPSSILEAAYYKTPIVFQNAAFTLSAWVRYRKRYNHYFRKHLEHLKRSEWWSTSQIQDFQSAQFVNIVRHAYQTVPFYRKWYDECGVDVNRINSLADLSKLPSLSKQMVREHQHEMLSTKYQSRALLKGLTSGTTGTPLKIFLTAEGSALQWAVWWRHKARFGLTPKDRHLTFGARVPVSQSQTGPPYWRHDYFNNRVYLSTYHISEATVPDIVAYLNRSHFDFFTGYPSALYELAGSMNKTGLRLYNRPKHIVCGSDALLPHYTTAIENAFGAPVTEQYGMVEFAGNMSKCECGIFHEDFECCYIEDLPCKHTLSRRLLLTGWGNDAMPFIRYEVGDTGVHLPETCSCGRNSRCFGDMEGRLEDYVVTPDGRKVVGMNQVFEYATHAREMQIWQETRDKVEFRIIADEDFGTADKEALAREFQRRVGNKMRIDFRIVDRLERSPNGKLKAVVSALTE